MRFFGTVIGALVYTFTTMLITAAKRREFRANFKRQIIENIVKKHALSYDKDRGLELDDFFTIYGCRVDEWSSEDLISGEIDGVSVKFSDFYAVKKVKPKRSCYFKACFLRPILIKIKLYNANRTREFAKFSNLRQKGEYGRREI